MTMMSWRFMYWLFFAVGVIRVFLGAAVLLRSARHPTPQGSARDSDGAHSCRAERDVDRGGSGARRILDTT